MSEANSSSLFDIIPAAKDFTPNYCILKFIEKNVFDRPFLRQQHAGANDGTELNSSLIP
jgi:hypothetical protein